MHYRIRGHTGVQVSVLVLEMAPFDRLARAAQERSPPRRCRLNSAMAAGCRCRGRMTLMDTANIAWTLSTGQGTARPTGWPATPPLAIVLC